VAPESDGLPKVAPAASFTLRAGSHPPRLQRSTAQHVRWEKAAAAHPPSRLNTLAHAGVMSTAAGNRLVSGGLKLERHLLRSTPGPALVPNFGPVLAEWQKHGADAQVCQQRMHSSACLLMPCTYSTISQSTSATKLRS